MERVKKLPWFLILATAWPVLSLLNSNLGVVTFSDSFQCLAMVWGSTIVLFLIFLAIFRHVNKAAIFSTLLVLITFSYGHFLQIWPDFSFRAGSLYIGPNKLLSLFLALLSFVLFLALYRSKKDFRNIAVFNFMALLLVVMPLISIAIAPKQENDEFESPPHAAEPATTEYPPVYYIILDAYTRADILQKIYNFDNSTFNQSLKDRGFYIADSSYSNYPWTMMSIPSSLNFAYLDSLSEDVIEFANETEHQVNHAGIAEELKSLDYQTVAFDNSNFRWTTMDQADLFIKSPGRKMNLLWNRLLHMTPFPHLPFWQALSMKPQLLRHYHKNLFVFDKLEELASTGHRSFYFVHFLVGHRPFIFDAAGNFRLPKDEFATFYSHADAYTNENLDIYKKLYIDQVQFFSNRIVQLVDSIQKNSPIDPIIVLQADHGTASKINITQKLTVDALEERFAIFNAYYFPNHNYRNVPATITPVNTFRVVLNDFFDYNTDILPNRHYYASGPRDTDFINVTAQLEGDAKDDQ